MAKKTLKKRPRQRKGLFDKFENVKTVTQNESLRFRDSKGRLVKFDGRKNLIAEVWLGNKRTNRVLNKTKKGQPVPQKFASNAMKKRIHFLEHVKKGPRVATEPKSKNISIDSRFTIVDNVDAKLPEIVNDTLIFSKRGNGSYVTVELTLKKSGENIHEVITAVIKSTKKDYISLELARLIVHRLYRNEQRASNMKISPMGNRAAYVRSFKARFTWDETKRLKEL